MSLERRLRRLEERARASVLSRCPTCSGPVPGVAISVIVDERGEPWHPVCAACGLPLDSSGRGMGHPAGAGIGTKVMVLARELAG